MAKRGLEGDGAAARSAVVAIEEARSARGAARGGDIRAIVHSVVSPGSVNSALEPLRMATKLDRYRETAPDGAGALAGGEGPRPAWRPAAVARGTGQGRPGSPNPARSAMAGLVGGHALTGSSARRRLDRASGCEDHQHPWGPPMSTQTSSHGSASWRVRPIVMVR
jgi:hypothetical protein